MDATTAPVIAADRLTKIYKGVTAVDGISFDLKKGRALSDEDQARLGLAFERITDAIELAGIE